MYANMGERNMYKKKFLNFRDGRKNIISTFMLMEVQGLWYLLKKEIWSSYSSSLFLFFLKSFKKMKNCSLEILSLFMQKDCQIFVFLNGFLRLDLRFLLDITCRILNSCMGVTRGGPDPPSKNFLHGNLFFWKIILHLKNFPTLFLSYTFLANHSCIIRINKKYNNLSIRTKKKLNPP